MANEINKCTIISGAPNCNIDFLKENIDVDSYIICADYGYQTALSIGIIPDLVVGDFDSSVMPEIDCEILRLNTEKEFTDTFHCIIEAQKRGYNDIDIFCAIGSRIDHTYSNILCLSYCLKNDVKCRIINEKNRISVISNFGIVYPEYDNFSLFAFMGNCTGVEIKGAYYTSDFYNKSELNFSIDSQFGQSNYVTEEYAEIHIKEGALLLIESND